MDNFDAWFSGFFDGEGSITCLAIVDKRGNRKIVFRCCLTQRSDELPLLHEIQARLGGIVYTKTGRNLSAWALDGPKGLVETLAPLFEAHPLRTKKAKEWAMVLPLARERYVDIPPGRTYTSKSLKEGYWERVRQVHLALSEGRGSWAHLVKERSFRKPKPRGRPVGVKETHPRRRS